MKRFVSCYQIPGKRKSRLLCEAFAAGVAAAGDGAQVLPEPPAKLLNGDAAFYGVRPAVAHLWEQAKAEGRDWYYIDNAYFDRARERYFRVTRNALQADGLNGCWEDDGAERLRELGIEVKPWRKDGAHIVICPQSDEFMETVCGWKGSWLEGVLALLRQHTDRPIIVRAKAEKRPFAQDLAGAWTLVTHMSAAAVEALIAGVPVFCTGRCAAQWLGSSDLASIESPYYPERRQLWAGLLAANQWTVDEVAAGVAWRALTQRS